MLNGYCYDTAVGKVVIKEEDGNIVEIVLAHLSTDDFVVNETETIKKAIKQLREYFEKKRTEFDLPLGPRKTNFQDKVWNYLLSIPYGETRTYQKIAEELGNKKAARAVGRANGSNRIFIVIPCHRVVGSDGSLTGYAGGIEMKKFLLELEGIN